jgi:hypothetical protein
MILALHPTTIEITTDEHLSRRGDCIVGVGAEKGCAGLSREAKRVLREVSSAVRLRIVVGGEVFETRARGDPRLTLTHPHDMVIRKSDYASDRTVAVSAGAASRDIPRSIVSALRRKDTVGFLEIGVDSPG